MTTPPLHLLRHAAAAAALFWLAACGGDVTGAPRPTAPLRFDISSAAGAFVPCGGEVPLTVTVTSDSSPVPGVLVNLRATVGGGSFFAGSGITNPSGVVKDYWTVGSVPNAIQTVEARGVDPVTGAKNVYGTHTVTTRTRIAFASNRDGDWDIYTALPDGSGLVQVTNDPGADITPAWSPDGTRLAFASSRAGNYEIYTVNADGTGLVRVTSAALEDYDPSWSPDGTRLAFSSRRTQDFEIFTANPYGTGLVRVTTQAGWDLDPAWSSPTTLVWVSHRDGNAEVYSAAANGVDVRRLTTFPGPDEQPAPMAWSPGLADPRIAFRREGKIYTIAADGSDLRVVNWGSSPAWSPDNRRLAFAANVDIAGEDRPIPRLEVLTMNPDGTDRGRVTFDLRHDDAPAWSGCTAF